MTSHFLLAQGPLILFWLLLLYIVDRCRKNRLAIPTVRQWPALFPEFLDRLSYNKNAQSLITRGYQEVGGRSGIANFRELPD